MTKQIVPESALGLRIRFRTTTATQFAIEAAKFVRPKERRAGKQVRIRERDGRHFLRSCQSADNIAILGSEELALQG